MKTTYSNSPPRAQKLGLVAVVLMLGLASTGVQAANTASGTTISNQATLNYTVGGVSQSPISSDDPSVGGTSDPTTFVVDNKVDLTVVEVGSSATSVSPGATSQVTQFTVTNTGNTTQDFLLSTSQPVGGTLFTFTDNFDTTACTIHPDTNNNGLDDDATSTTIDNLPADVNNSRSVWVHCDIPAGQANNDFSIVALTAEARDATTGGALTQTGANTPGVDIVFADTAGTDDGSRDAKSSARDGYRVQSAILSVSKTVSVVCDPFNSTTNPKNIPGAVVRWTVVVSNAAGSGSSATLSTISDTLSANLTFDPDLITGGGGAVGCEFAAAGSGTPENANGRGFRIQTSASRPLAGTAGGAAAVSSFFTSANDSDGADENAGTVTVDFGTAMPAGGSYSAGELKAGESVTVYFNSGIQ
jgi:hypothetical protein